MVLKECLKNHYQKVNSIRFVDYSNVKNQINVYKYFQFLLFIPNFMITFVKSLKKV